MEEYDTFSEVENMNSFNLFVLNVLIARDFWEPDNKATFRQNYTWGGWIHVKRNIRVRHVHDLIKFNIWRLIQQMKKKSPKQLTPLSQAFIIFCWIICVWRNVMILVFVLVSSVRLRSPHLFALLIISNRLPLLHSSVTFFSLSTNKLKQSEKVSMM